MVLRTMWRAAGDSIWRELGREIVKSACNVLVEETVEAAVEIWKKRRLKIQEEKLEHRDFTPEDADEGTGTADGADETSQRAAGEPAVEPGGAADSGRSAGDSSRIESLTDYAERRRNAAG